MSLAADPGEAQLLRRLLVTLEQLLALPTLDLKATLDAAATLIAPVIHAEKVDCFLYDPAIDSLVAQGISRTPLGQREQDLGLDRLPCANGGRSVEVWQTGVPYQTGRADTDPGELRGVTEGLGIRSVLAVPLQVQGERRGVLQVDSTRPEQFTPLDRDFLLAVAQWIGSIAHRAELAEQVRREEAAQARRRAADELITVLAHDLGNYLTPLAGRVDLMRRRAVREQHARFQADAEALAHVVTRLRRLIGDLLDAGRLDQGLFTLLPQPLDLVALVQDTAASLAGESCPIVVQAPDELALTADPARLRQALENLLANAVKYSPEGVAVTVTVQEEQRDGAPWAVVTVRDAGPGIAPELLPQLFGRFVAGPQSGGLGLGLYLAQQLVQAHGGTLTVQSQLGAGTQFMLAVPVTPRPAR